VLKSKWEYGELYKKYDMEGEIKIGTGIVKVHDIFLPLPEFMKKADVLFIDPPCSKANINSFYTKADRTDYQTSYEPFHKRLFQCIDEINPRELFLEVFKSNRDIFITECEQRFTSVVVSPTTYYHSKKNVCWIIHATNTTETISFDGWDEEDAIKFICENVDYNCIGDLCMGRGLVGFHANKAGKSFVGTEINKKRLAVLLDGIETGKHKY
jgi:hypothetical protein